MFVGKSYAQTGDIRGRIVSEEQGLPFVNVAIINSRFGSISDEKGNFKLNGIKAGQHRLAFSSIGYTTITKEIELKENEVLELKISMEKQVKTYDDVVISANFKEVSRSESPVPIEVYSKEFFKSNPSPSIYEVMDNVNGVRPQINCSVCNTGDIHINGLEGAYTMVLIDGMPIVSGLSTVYGLFGIPRELIERVEIVKGPASTLYGSEAVGGLINVITKDPSNAPLFSADLYTTTWAEINGDFSMKFKLSDKVNSLLGVNYFNYSNPQDRNDDNFTDIALQDRVSVFNKWLVKRKDGKKLSIGGRYVYEDRWGGEMNWPPAFRGGDEIYGESIYTQRWELFGTYDLPGKEDFNLSLSANGHYQNSVYGALDYQGAQNIGFGQFSWNKNLGTRNTLLVGTALRYTYYDDNTPVTSSNDGLASNAPSEILLPGVFIQNEFKMNSQNKVLFGARYDYNSIHGEILSPRLNYKWNSKSKKNVIRLSLGNGYRVANVFTEDHAALTGARTVVFLSDLEPERSWNSNINYVLKIYGKKELIINLDASLFYTYFNNRIFADYDANPNLVVYDNLNVHAVSQGASMSVDLSYRQLNFNAGFTAMDVYSVNQGIKEQQELTERYSGNWNLSYRFDRLNLRVNYSGNLYGPMRIPLLGELDPRPEFTPWWSIQNIQITKKFQKEYELYFGVKNLLNWTPDRSTPFLIARSQDPFDRGVDFDQNGNVLASPTNPNALSFDAAYVYAPQQGIRGFLGFRMFLNR